MATDKRLDAKLSKLVEELKTGVKGAPCVAGILNRIPPEYGRHVVKAIAGFGYRDGRQDKREGPEAWNGQDSLATSSISDGCCDVVAVIFWLDGQQWPEAPTARANEGECLYRATWTLAPKQQISSAALTSPKINDLFQLVEEE